MYVMGGLGMRVKVQCMYTYRGVPTNHSPHVVVRMSQT